MSDHKKSLRVEALRLRQDLAGHAGLAEAAADRLIGTVALRAASVVALYHPCGSELEIMPLAARLWAAGISCALPLVQPGLAPLRFAEWRQAGRLVEGPFKIPVPEEPEFVTPDVVVVPLLAFDAQGYRLGYGRGHYDATLKEARAHRAVLAVGYAYDGQQAAGPLPAEDHDERLELVVTPSSVFDFRG